MSQTISRRDTQVTKKDKVTFGGWVMKICQKTGLDRQTIILMMKYAMNLPTCEQGTIANLKSEVDWLRQLLSPCKWTHHLIRSHLTRELDTKPQMWQMSTPRSATL